MPGRDWRASACMDRSISHGSSVPLRLRHATFKPVPLSTSESSSAHARRLERNALRAPREIQLDVGELACARRRHLRADAEQARANAPLQRTDSLPFEPIRRKCTRMTLAEGLGKQALSPVLIVALRAREVHLPVPLAVERAAAFERRARGPVDGYGDGHSTRLVGNPGRQRQQVVVFGRQRRRPAAAGYGMIRCVLRG